MIYLEAQIPRNGNLFSAIFARDETTGEIDLDLHDPDLAQQYVRLLQTFKRVRPRYFQSLWEDGVLDAQTFVVRTEMNTKNNSRGAVTFRLMTPRELIAHLEAEAEEEICIDVSPLPPDNYRPAIDYDETRRVWTYEERLIIIDEQGERKTQITHTIIDHKGDIVGEKVMYEDYHPTTVSPSIIRSIQSQIKRA